MGPARGSQGRREYGFSPERPTAVFVLGRMGHWNGDRDCEPAHQLTFRGSDEALSTQEVERRKKDPA